MKVKLAISPGDPTGIGPDICIQAFSSQRQLDYLPVIFGDPYVFEKRAKDLKKNLKIKLYSGNEENIEDDCLIIHPVNMTEEIITGESNPKNAHYIISILKESATRTLNGEFDALVTGPINKQIINQGGIDFFGHTEFLANLSNTPKVVMMLVNESLKVALATTHVPLNQVSKMITEENIEQCINIIRKDLQTKWMINNPVIKVLGLNPHAGDGGFLGQEEKDILIPLIKKLRDLKYKIIGPDSADTAFVKDNMKGVDAILAMYHDQGLPVIKSSGFGNIVNITLGLPFIRTSVDHGTAYDLAGSGKANENSILNASNLAYSMSLN
tara:strand:+ start:4543 stop:5520 length:978 start_codon:yes stop_codon:yes gene_type:complete